jgi:hypothetical protein
LLNQSAPKPTGHLNLSKKTCSCTTERRIAALQQPHEISQASLPETYRALSKPAGYPLIGIHFQRNPMSIVFKAIGRDRSGNDND